MPKKKSDKEARGKKEPARNAVTKPKKVSAAKTLVAIPETAAPAELAPAKGKAAKDAKPAAKKVTAKKPPVVISIDDIALRAYFIAERRQKLGWPGDSTGDWVEAERQLRAEAKKKKA